MIVIDDKIISDDIKDVCFQCDLNACKGACCIEGDEGAPLEENEISIIEDYLDKVKPFMTEAGRKVIDQLGVFDYGADGSYVTPLVNGGACAFVYIKDGIALCAIESAYRKGIIDYAKPISCHLYPIRLKKHEAKNPEDSFIAVNYHKWQVCKPALKNGKKLDLPIYKSLKEPLIRAFGEEFYRELVGLVVEKWLNSISLSTLRGAMFNHFKGTFLHEAILPVIDPGSFKMNTD